jgi:hypothetical protein
LSQNDITDMVKGAAPDIACVDLDKMFHPVKHFPGCFIGEGEKENRVGGYSFFKESGNPVGNDAGLAAPSSGDNENGTIFAEDNLELFLVQLFRVIDKRRRYGSVSMNGVSFHGL